MNDILNQLDEFFYQQKESERNVFFILPFLLAGFLSYYFVYPITDEALTTAINEKNSIESKIQKKKQENMGLKTANKRIPVKIKRIENEVKNMQSIQNRLSELLNNIRFVVFDLNKWAEIYNKIPQYIKDNNLMVLKIDNQLFLENSSVKNQKNVKDLVKLKMQIILEVAGNFPNVVRFIKTFEGQRELVKIEQLETDGEVSKITINIYGAEI